MTTDRIVDLANKGYITQVETAENLAKLSEVELVEKGFITQTCVFDGSDDTIDEVPVVAPVEPEVEPEDEPVVDEGEEDEPAAEDLPNTEIETPEEEEGEL